MLTKGAIGNLINRYKAVLKKCHLINTFGSLAVASMLVLGGAGVAGAAEQTIELKGEDVLYDVPESYLRSGYNGDQPNPLTVNGTGIETMTLQGSNGQCVIASYGNGKIYVNNIDKMVITGQYMSGDANVGYDGNAIYAQGTGSSAIVDINMPNGVIETEGTLTGTMLFHSTSNATRTSQINVKAKKIDTKTNSNSIVCQNGGSIKFEADDITMLSTNATAVTVFNSMSSVDLDAINGNLSITSGSSNAVSLSSPGGTVKLNASEDVILDGATNAINLTGTDATVTVSAGGNVTLSGNVTNASSGAIDLSGKNTTITGNILNEGSGSIGVSSADSVTVNGNVKATDGNVTVSADSGITVNGGVMSYGGNITFNDSTTINLAGTAPATAWGSTLTLGNDKSDNVSISVVDTSSTRTNPAKGLWAYAANSKVAVTANTLDITLKADSGQGSIHGLHAQNNTDKNETLESERASISIDSNQTNINITKDGNPYGHAIVALSEGIIDIKGNLTASAKNVIAARGNSKVTVGKAGETVKLDGDIEFNYSGSTSGSAIDALVDVTLTGSKSYWNGNALAGWDSLAEAPENNALLEVNDLKIALNDGATWTPTKVDYENTVVEGKNYGQAALSINELSLGGGVIVLNEGITIGADDFQSKAGIINFAGNGTVAADIKGESVTVSGTEGTIDKISTEGLTVDGAALKLNNGLVDMKTIAFANGGSLNMSDSGVSPVTVISAGEGARTAITGDATINVSGTGGAYGVYATDGSTVTMGDTNITTNGQESTYAVRANDASVVTLGETTVSAASEKKARGVTAFSGSTLTVGREGGVNTITATATNGTSWGVIANNAGTNLTFTGVTTINAESNGDYVNGLSTGGGYVAGKDTQAHVTFNDDVTINAKAKNASEVNYWTDGVYAADSELTFKGKTTVNVSGDAAFVRGMVALGDKKDNTGITTFDFNGDVDIDVTATSEAYGMMLIGGDAAANGTLFDVYAKSENGRATGLMVQHESDSTFSASANATILAEGNSAIGIDMPEYYGTGSITLNGVSNSITAKGKAEAYAMNFENGATLSTTGATTLAATADAAANAHALYGDGTITNTGDLIVESGKLSGFTGVYTQTGANASTDIQGAEDFFGGTVTIEGGSLTVDAAKLGTVGEASAVTTGINSSLSVAENAALKVDFSGHKYKTYTLAEYFKAQEVLLNGDEGDLVFLNAKLEKGESDTILLGQTGGVAASDIVFAAKGYQSYNDAVAADPSQKFSAAAGDMVTLADADRKDHVNKATSVSFGSALIAQGMNVGAMTDLTVKEGVNLQFAATNADGLFIGSDGKETAVNVTVEEGASLALGIAGQDGKQNATLGDVTVAGTYGIDAESGSTTLSGGTFDLGNGTTDAKYTFDAVTVNGFHNVYGNGIENTEIDYGTLTVNGVANITDASVMVSGYVKQSDASSGVGELGRMDVYGTTNITDSTLSVASHINVYDTFSAKNTDVETAHFASYGTTSITDGAVDVDTFIVHKGKTTLDGITGDITNFIVESGEAVIDGVKDVVKNLAVENGTVTLNASTVTGEATVSGGNLNASGADFGSVTMTGGTFTADASSSVADKLSVGEKASAKLTGTSLGALESAGTTTMTGGKVTGAASITGGSLTADKVEFANVTQTKGSIIASGSTFGKVSMADGTFEAKGNSEFAALDVSKGAASLDASTVSGDTIVSADGTLTATNGSALNSLIVRGEKSSATVADSTIGGFLVAEDGASIDITAKEALTFNGSISNGSNANDKPYGPGSISIFANNLAFNDDITNGVNGADGGVMTLSATDSLAVKGDVENNGMLTIEAATVEIDATVAEGVDAKSALCGNGTTTVTADTIALKANSEPAIFTNGNVTLNAKKASTISGGIMMGSEAIVALNGDFALTGDLAGEGTVANAGVFTVENGKLSGFTGVFNQTAGSTVLTKDNGFFGGKVNLEGGTMTAHTVAPKADVTVGDKTTLTVVNSLDLSNGSLYVTGGSVDATGATITEGKGSITIGGGSFTADADEVLNFTLGDKEEKKELGKDIAAAGNMGTTLKGTEGTVTLDFGSEFTYTLDQFKAAELALFGDRSETKENAILKFLNGELTIAEDTNVLIGATEDKKTLEDGAEYTKATIDSESKPTQVTEGSSVNSTPDHHGHETAFDDHVVKIVDNHDPDHEPLNVDEIHAQGPDFHAKALEVGKDSGKHDGSVHLHVNDHHDGESSNVLLAGTGKGLLVAENDKGELEAVKVDVTIDKNSSFTIGQGKDVKENIQAEIEKADVKGKHKVDGNNKDHTDNGNHYGHTKIKYGEMLIGDAKDKSGKGGEVRILNASVHIGKLDIHHGRFFLDPAYAKIDDATISGGELLIGSGSVAEIGTVDDLGTKLTDAGFTVKEQPGGGFTVQEGKEAALALGKAIDVTGGKLTVDPSMHDGNVVEVNGSGTSDGKATFANGSLLIVDHDLIDDGAVIKASSADINKGAKLYIANALGGLEGKTVIDVTDATSTSFENWEVVTNALVGAEVTKDTTSGDIIISTTSKDASDVYEGLIPVDSLNTMMADELNNVDAAEVGNKFLARIIDENYLAPSKTVDVANEVSRAAVTAGVQNTALRITDAASKTVVSHMSLSQHDASSAIHADGVDFWAAPMYGNLYTSGMVTSGSSVRGQFGGLALGADLEAGQFLGGKFRLGAAINGGGGQSETKGAATSTQNDYDFGGLNFYAGWNSGALNVIASVGYGFGNHEVEMGLPVAGVNNAKADIDTSAFTADLRAEYQLKTPYVDILPHAGIRYTALKTEAHDLKANGSVLNSVESDTQNIVQFPVGVTLSKDIDLSGWNVKPSVDVSVIPAAGEKKATTKVKFSGIDAWDSVNTRVMDSTSWAGAVGIQAEKGNMTFGLNYGVQASSNETDQNIQVKFGWKF